MIQCFSLTTKQHQLAYKPQKRFSKGGGLSRHQACVVIFSIVSLAVADLSDNLKSWAWLLNASGQRMAA